MIGNIESLKAELEDLDKKRADIIDMIKAVCSHKNVRHVGYRGDGG